MKKNTSLFYLVLLGVALAVPWLMQKASPGEPPKKPSGGEAAQRQHEPTAAKPVAARAAVAKPPPATEKTFLIETEHFSARVSDVNAGVKSFKLKDEQFERDGHATNVVTTDKPAYYPLTFRLQGAELGTEHWQVEPEGARVVRLHTEADGVAIARKLEAGSGPYQLWVTTTLENRGDTARKLTLEETTYHYVPRAAESGGVPLLPARSSAISGGLCLHADDLEREDRKALAEGKHWSDAVQFVGLENVYFLNALVAVDKEERS